MKRLLTALGLLCCVLSTVFAENTYASERLADPVFEINRINDQLNGYWTSSTLGGGFYYLSATLYGGQSYDFTMTGMAFPYAPGPEFAAEPVATMFVYFDWSRVNPEAWMNRSLAQSPALAGVTTDTSIIYSYITQYVKSFPSYTVPTGLQAGVYYGEAWLVEGAHDLTALNGDLAAMDGYIYPKTLKVNYIPENNQPSPVPEPASLLLLGTGLAGIPGIGLLKKKLKA